MNLDDGERQEIERRQQLVSDVYHTLGQPLTELRCLLDLALHKSLDREGYHLALQQALRATERVITAASFARQLAEAEDPGHCERVIDLAASLRETIEEFEPVAEAYDLDIGRSLPSAIRIAADPDRIRRALFLIFDHLVHVASRGTRITVDARLLDGCASVELFTHAQQLLWRNEPDAPFSTPADCMNRSLQLAERMIRAAGGMLNERNDAAGCAISVRFPLAEPFVSAE